MGFVYRTAVPVRTVGSGLLSSALNAIYPASRLPRAQVAVTSFPYMSVQLTPGLVQWASQVSSTWARALEGISAEKSEENALSLVGLGPSAPTMPESEDSGLWDGILLAAPKKKVSHSRKAMRAANKGLKDRVSTYSLLLNANALDLVHCPACARPKLQHHICEHCYSEFSRGLKQKAKSSQAA